MTPQTSTIPGLFAAQLRRSPDAPALVVGTRRLTYRELDRRSLELAHRLRLTGVRRGDVVAVCSSRPQDMIVGLLGVMRADAAYLPLDPDYPHARLALMVEDSRSVCVVTGPRETVPGVAGLPTVEITDGDDGAEREAPPAGHGPEDVAYVLYTSGSTGRPKGVQVPHRAFVSFARGLREALDQAPVWDEGASTMLCTSLSFDGSMKSIVLMLHGVALHLPEHRTDTAELARYVREHGVTSVSCTPTLLQLLIDDGLFEGAVERPVHVFVGGEAPGADIWERLASWPGVSASNHYGPTECTVNATVAPVDGGPPALGEPIAGTRVHVLGPDLAPVEEGEVGELYIAGSGVAHGYRNSPSLTAERFVVDPFGEPGTRMYRSGDLVRRGTHGTLQFVGREDQQVQINGLRVELGEIESVLLAHPLVAEAVVLARSDKADERRLVSYVRLDPANAELTSEEVRSHVTRSLPDHMLPSGIRVLDRMPVDAHGKLDRRALSDLNEESVEHVDNYVAPRTPTEVTLARIWSEILAVPEIGLTDDFFDLGGHSLLAIRVMSRVRDELGAELRLRSFLENATLVRMAEHIAVARPGTPPIMGSSSLLEGGRV